MASLRVFAVASVLLIPVHSSRGHGASMAVPHSGPAISLGLRYSPQIGGVESERPGIYFFLRFLPAFAMSFLR